MKAFIAIVLALSVLAGCKGGGISEKEVVGTWKADSAKSELGPQGSMDEKEKQMAMAMLSTMSLNLKDDKTCELTLIFPLKGTWTLTGNKLVVTPEKKEGETSSFGGKDTMDFEVAADGKSMTFTSSDPKKPGKLVMIKS